MLITDLDIGTPKNKQLQIKGKKGNQVEKNKNKYLVKITQMSDDDSEYETIPKKEKLKKCIFQMD
jgi:hypothetical protein